MNLTKRRKITAIITLSVMIVAVVATACILTIPNLYKGEDVAAINTAAYGMKQVSYNKNNTAMLYHTGKEGGDVRILFPTSIYIDKSEKLQDVGYYFISDTWYKCGGAKSGWYLSDSVFGKYSNYSDLEISETSNENRLGYLFDYSLGREALSNVVTSGDDAMIEEYWSDCKNNSTKIIASNHSSNVGMKFAMQGSVKSSVENKTYTFNSVNDVILGKQKWYGSQLWNKYWQDVSNSTFYSFDSGHNDTQTLAGTNFTVGTNVGGYVDKKMTISINIYDKSALNTAINTFQAKINSNKDILAKINGSGTCFTRAQNFIDDIKNNYLTKREVTQDQINAAVTSINNYVFELDKPDSTLKGSKNYDGNAVSISSFWNRYDATYYNLSVNGSNTSTEIKNVGNYEIKVSPKTEVNGLKFRWVTDKNNAELTVGTYTINPATFQVTGIDKITRQFKNSNFNFNLASATSSGTLNDNNFSGFYSPSENAKTIQLYLSSTELDAATIDWTGTSDNVTVKDVGNYYVYYKVSAPNHNAAVGSFAVEITKANIELIVSSYNQIYGDDLLTSDEIIDNMLTESRILDADDWNTAKVYIKDLLTFNVEVTSFTTGTNYANVGEYTINFARNTSSALNNSINSIIFKDAHNRSAYKVVQREVQVGWTQKTNMWYDGTGGKRPSAQIVGDNFASGTDTDLSAVTITAVAGPDGKIPELVNYEAIYAGKYMAHVSCLNSNYKVDETTNHCDFEILRRPVTVELQDRTRIYAQSMTAPEVWLNYTNVLFPANSDNSIYVATTTATDGKSVFIGAVTDVFEIVNNVTDSDYTSQNDAEKYYKVNEAGYDLTPVLKNKNNYEFVNCKGAKFYVTPAGIDLSLQQIASKVYNAQDQALVMPNNNTVISLKGYEATHREGVVIEYSDTEGGTYTTDALTLRNVGTKNVYYRVTAPNHKVNTGHFTAEITRAHIYVDVNGTKEVEYGTKLPTSQELIDDFGITWSWTNPANQFDFSKEVEFAVLDGTGGSNYITSRRQNVGNYTVSHRVLDEAIKDNYLFEYRTNAQGTHKNIGVYKIVAKTLYVKWAQSGANWADGLKYIYDGNAPKVQPVAPDTLEDGTENVVVVKGEDGTVLERDNIVLSLITLSGNRKGSYTVSTSLTNPVNQRNYVLGNAQETFEIIPRTIQINVLNQFAKYGNAKSVPMGSSLLAPTNANAMWDYADGSAEFISDHYASYRLTTIAQNPDKYMDVGDYPIIVEPIESATGEIVDNYDVSVVTEGAPSDMQATFSITPASIHYMGRQFNIDFDKELRFVTKGQISERISTSIDTPSDEFVVEMSDLFKEDITIDEVTNWVESQTTEVGNDGLGRYNVWIRITHKKDNYETFVAKVEVNILSDWVSIIVSNKIQAEYGNTTHSSQALFDGLDFTAIYGIMNDNNTEDKPLEEAKAVLEGYVKSGDIKFIVGSGDTVTAMENNDAYGSYSIYIIIPDGKNPAHKNFRFLPYDTNHTSNIDAYVVGKRNIGIDWGEMDEIYGEHRGEETSDPSASHVYTLKNVLDDDNDVRVDIEYYLKTATGEELINGHVKNVGTYIAKVVGVRGGGDNYKLPENELRVEFQVTPRPITVEVADNSIAYGDRDATRDGINEFLNREVVGKTLYTILNDSTSMGLASGDTASNIFKLAIDATLDSTFNYWKVGSYDITVEELSDNYTITPVKGSLKVNKAGTIGYDRQQIASKTYNGEDISVAPVNVLQYMTLTGDGDLLKSGVKVYYKLSGDDNSKFAENYYVKLAGTYSVDIKITEDNHTDTIVTGLTFMVERAKVVITMVQTDKTYGDTLADLLAADGTVTTFSDWLKKHCEIEIKAYTNSGQEFDVTGLQEDFEFKVIQKGEGNGDALEVGKNPVGTYRVYHLNDIELTATKYIIDYYQEDPTLPDEEQYKCNAEAYNITRREAVVEWTGGNRFEYSGDDVVDRLTASVTLLGNEIINLSYTSLPRDAFADKERMPAINVGHYTAKVDTSDAFGLYAELGNYYFSNDMFDFEIYAKQVTVTINNQTRVYGEADTKVGVWAEHTEYTCDVELDGQPITLSIVGTTDREYYGVGRYAIKGECHSDNYDVTFKGQGSDNDTAVFEVTAAEMTINVARYPISYNGKEFTVDVKKIIADEGDYKIHGDMKWEEATVLYKQEDGTYTSTVPVIDGVTDSSGQVITYQVQLANHQTEANRTMTIEIRPANVEINITNGGATSVYGEGLLDSDKLFEVCNPVQDEEKSDMLVDIKSILILKVNATGDNPNKGHYNITYELKSEYKNLYKVKLNGGTDAYEVTAKELKIVWDYTKPYTYNAYPQAVSNGNLLEGIIAGDVVTVDYQDWVFVDAGDYVAKAVNVSNPNYKLGETASLKWRINPKQIEIEWGEDDFTYDGKIHTPSTPKVKDGQLCNNDTCSIAVIALERINAGTHDVKAESMNGNYVIKNNCEWSTFVIKPAVVTIEWDEVSLTYDGTMQAPTASVIGGLIGADECEVVVEGKQKLAGNDYTATATLSNSNYTVVANVTKTYSIAPKAITFEWSSETSLTYTGDRQVPRANAVGAISGDAVEFDIQIAEEKEGINVGDYTATVVGVLANSNYVVDFSGVTETSVNYTIVKGTNEFTTEITLPETVGKLPWNGDDKPVSKWGDVVVKYYSDEACTKEITDVDNAGEGIYWIKAYVAGNDNYDEISTIVKVEVQGGFNVAIVIIGAIVSVALLIATIVVVHTANKKKQQGGAV